MTIGECVKNYCYEHSLSYRSFAKLCGLSSGYISMLVNGRNPKTGKPITPDVDTYVRLASCMGMTLDELFHKIDDSPIRVNYHAKYSIQIDHAAMESTSYALDNALSAELRDMSDEDKQDVVDYMRFRRAQRAKREP